MAITPEQARRELARRELEKRKQGKSSSVISKINKAALGVVQAPLTAMSAPIEMVGEAIRMPIEQDSNFRAPTIFQNIGLADKTERPPATPFSIPIKLIQSGAEYLRNLPKGMEAAGEAGLREYYREQGIPEAVQETILAALVGRISPAVSNAPVDASVRGIQALAKGVSKATGYVGKKSARVLLGPTEEAIAARFARPDAVKGAAPFDELADEFAGTVNQLAKKVDDIDNEAWDTLLKLKAEPRSKILKVLKDVQRDFKGTGKSKIGDADRGAVAKIDEYIERVKNIRQPGVKPELDQMLDQRQLREIVQSVRRDAKFGGIQDTPTNLAAKKIQAKLDAMLKENGNYAEVMERLAPATKTLKEVSRKFQLKREPGQGFVPSDTTVSKLSTFKEAKKPATAKALDSLKRETGADFKDKVNLANYRKEFEPGERSRGSARTVLGTVIGGALGGGVGGYAGGGTGALIGSGLGRAADYYGGAGAGKIIDALSKGGTKTGDLLNVAKAGAKRSNLDLLLDKLRRQAPILSTFRSYR